MADEPVNRAGTVSELPATEVKNAWHACLDRVSQAREEIVITRYGKPIAKLTPVGDEEEEAEIFGYLAGTVTVRGDIVAPIGGTWEADEGP